MRTQSFIFFHQQDHYFKFKRSKKFAALPNLRFVFLGHREAGALTGMEDVIISRNLPVNIEGYPGLTAFTGWYSLHHNHLIDCDYVNLFEYDIDLVDDFWGLVEKELATSPDFIGYVPVPLDNFHYVNNIIWVYRIIPAIRQEYGIDICRVVHSKVREGIVGYWSSTSNATFKWNSFCEYMEWFGKLLDHIKDSKTAGHAFERSLSFFYFVRNKDARIINHVLRHHQLDSHETSYG